MPSTANTPLLHCGYIEAENDSFMFEVVINCQALHPQLVSLFYFILPFIIINTVFHRHHLTVYALRTKIIACP